MMNRRKLVGVGVGVVLGLLSSVGAIVVLFLVAAALFGDLNFAVGPR